MEAVEYTVTTFPPFWVIALCVLALGLLVMWAVNRRNKQEQPVEQIEIRGICGSCGGHIQLGEGYTKQHGEYFHRKCWKQIKRGY